MEGNHIRFTLPVLQADRYVLRVNGKGSTGVEACEGFNFCHAKLDKWVEVPIIIE